MLSTFMERTGITYRDLGSFLEVSPTLLHLHIGSTRSLPAHATLQLTLAHRTIIAQGHIAARALPVYPVLAADDLLFMQQEAQWCLVRCRPLQNKLDAMQQKYQQGADTLPLLDILANEPGNQTDKKKRWIAEQRYQAQKKMEDNDVMKQKKLAVAIGLLQHEASLWEN